MKKISKTRFDQYAKDPVKFLRELAVPGTEVGKQFDEVWADFQKDAFERLAPCLLAVAKGEVPPERGHWFERTKGASKDSDVGCCILWVLLFARSPVLIEIGAEQQEQARETLLAMKAIVRLNPWMKPLIEFFQYVVKSKQTEARMEVLTTTKTGAHGSRPQMSICNELSHITVKEFADTLMDNAEKEGENFAIIATNAGYLHTWQYDWREVYRRDEDWWFQKVAEPAPWIAERNLRSAQLRNSATRYNRLWQGIWSPQQGDAIDPEDIDAAIRMQGPMSPEMVRDNGYVVVQGVDAGIKHDHAAVVHLAVRRGEPRVHLARCESWAPIHGKIDLSQLEAAILRGWSDFPCLGCCYDPTQMEYIRQRVEKRGVVCDPIYVPRREGDIMARTILEHFRNRLISIYPDELFVRDLHRLSIRETRYGEHKLEAVRDEYGHADRAIAFALALPAAALVARQEPITDEANAEHYVEVT
jgi:hypothetical protein